MSDYFDAGLRDGTINAFAVIRSHLEKLDGFNSADFDKDIQGIISNVEGAQGVTPDYIHGFKAPFSGLEDSNVRKKWGLNHD